MDIAKRVQPLPAYVAVKLLEAETTTSYGIELPDTAQEKPQLGEVLAVGRIPKETLIKEGIESSLDSATMLEIQSRVANGFVIAFKKYTGHPVKIEGEEIQLVHFNDILCVIEREDK